MTRATRKQMHQDHRTWKSEDDMWRDDARLWEEEVVTAQKELSLVQSALTQHLQTLQKHAAAVRLYETRCDTHEQALVDCECGQRDVRLEAMNEAHGREADKHDDLRATHERIKRHHHTRMAQWNLLVKALEAPL